MIFYISKGIRNESKHDWDSTSSCLRSHFGLCLGTYRTLQNDDVDFTMMCTSNIFLSHSISLCRISVQLKTKIKAIVVHSLHVLHIISIKERSLLIAIMNTSSPWKKKDSENPQKKRTWNESFELLRSYQAAHGHCNIPRSYAEHPALVGWTFYQRKIQANLPESKRRRLKQIGFFDTYIPKKQKNDQKWMEKWKRLRAYKQKYGDCRVPRAQTVNEELKPWGVELGEWVKRQRQFYH